jgi:hypothetical protein
MIALICANAVSKNVLQAFGAYVKVRSCTGTSAKSIGVEREQAAAMKDTPIERDFDKSR